LLWSGSDERFDREVWAKLISIAQKHAVPRWRKPAVNPAPEMLTLEMVMPAVPELVTVAGMVDFAPMVMVPKAKLEGFTVRLAVGAALTVRVALALVTLPAELVMMTLKRDPLSEVVVAGVV